MITLVLLLLSAGVLFRLLANAYASGLSSVPGPFWRKFTDLFQLVDSVQKRTTASLQEIHQKYGKVVRIGPNTVSLMDAAMIEPIYGIHSDLPKSDHFKTWENNINGKPMPNIATIQDKNIHSAIKRPIAAAYSMSNLARLETYVDDTIRYFVKRLDEEFIAGEKGGRACPIDTWLQYFAYDVIGEITFSSKFGFLEAGADVEGIFKALEKEFDYRAIVMNMPWLDFYLRKNPLVLYFAKPTSPFQKRARKLLQSRMSQSSPDASRRDLLSQFMEARMAHPDVVDDRVLTGYVSAPLLAGSDTTAVVLRTIIYYLLRNAELVKKLCAELDGAQLKLPASFKEASELPYLDAVIKEALRIHPISALIFRRTVQASGLTLPDGRTLPPGTVVGLAPWISHFDKDIFGHDAEVFNPDRWLQSPNETMEEFTTRSRAMAKADMAWGYGSRACLGKNIARSEIYKIVPTLFLVFNMELVDPNAEWKVEERLVSKQTGMDIRISRRPGASLSTLI